MEKGIFRVILYSLGGLFLGLIAGLILGSPLEVIGGEIRILEFIMGGLGGMAGLILGGGYGGWGGKKWALSCAWLGAVIVSGVGLFLSFVGSEWMYATIGFIISGTILIFTLFYLHK